MAAPLAAAPMTQAEQALLDPRCYPVLGEPRSALERDTRLVWTLIGIVRLLPRHGLTGDARVLLGHLAHQACLGPAALARRIERDRPGLFGLLIVAEALAAPVTPAGTDPASPGATLR